MSKFSELRDKIEKREGYSKEAATKTAAAIGRAKYGAKGMTEKAAAARRGHDSAYDRQMRGEYVSGRDMARERRR